MYTTQCAQDRNNVQCDNKKRNYSRLQSKKRFEACAQIQVENVVLHELAVFGGFSSLNACEDRIYV